MGASEPTPFKKVIKLTVRKTVMTHIMNYLNFFLRSFATYSIDVYRTAVKESCRTTSFLALLDAEGTKVVDLTGLNSEDEDTSTLLDLVRTGGVSPRF
jgi:hypothetical protein